MTDRIRRAPLSNRAADWNLVLVWVVIIIGLLTAIGCVGFILNESLTSYATCSVRNEGCRGDAGWYSSMGLTLFGGFAAVITGGAIGIRSHTRRSGVLYPLAGLGGLLLLTAVGYALLKALTGTELAGAVQHEPADCTIALHTALSRCPDRPSGQEPVAEGQ